MMLCAPYLSSLEESTMCAAVCGKPIHTKKTPSGLFGQVYQAHKARAICSYAKLDVCIKLYYS